MGEPMDDLLLDKLQVCAFFGGTKPINPATLYRWIKQGRCPPPIRIGPQVRRWKRSDCEAALRLLESRS
jgi:predicted DNA-binding transcriptional regulator AlpA